MVSETTTQKVRKIRRYEVVAGVLAETYEFSTVEKLAESCKMETRKFAQSISKAKILLSMRGIIIVNKVGRGYRVGNFAEFRREVDKSCRRAISHTKSMLRQIKLLKQSGQINEDFSQLEDLIEHNVETIRALFHSPTMDEFESYDEYSAARQDHFDATKLTPDFVESVPLESVNDHKSTNPGI